MKHKLKCLLRTYDRKALDSRKLTYEEAIALNLRVFDVVLASCLGIVGYRDNNGWHDFKNGGRGLGGSTGDLLRAIMLHPKFWLTKYALSQLVTQDNIMNPGVLPALTYRLRCLFNEREKNARFILTSKQGEDFCLMWPADHSWAMLDLIIDEKPKK